MANQKPLNNRVMDSLLKTALMGSADMSKLKTSIHSLFGVSVSVEELKKLDTFHQLFEKVKAEQLKTKTL